MKAELHMTLNEAGGITMDIEGPFPSILKMMLAAIIEFKEMKWQTDEEQRKVDDALYMFLLKVGNIISR